MSGGPQGRRSAARSSVRLGAAGRRRAAPEGPCGRLGRAGPGGSEPRGALWVPGAARLPPVGFYSFRSAVPGIAALGVGAAVLLYGVGELRGPPQHRDRPAAAGGPERCVTPRCRAVLGRRAAGRNAGASFLLPPLEERERNLP